MAAPFPHLNVCSAYSMRYGTAFPQALARRAAEDGMDILALTDRDGLYGAVKHAHACADAGIGPVLGVSLALAAQGTGFDPVPGAEAGLDPDLLPGFAPRPGRGSGRGAGRGSGRSGGHGPGSRSGRPRTGPDSADRVTVLARSGGWSRLARLVTAAHYAAERGAPRITRELVATWAGSGADGLVVLLGPRSDVGRAVAERRDDRARALLDLWRSTVPGGVVVELVDQYGYRDAITAVRMLALAESLGVPAVLTNAVRYLDPADHQVGDVLDAARQLVPLHPRHLERATSHAYLKSTKDMRQVAAKICGSDQTRIADLLRTTRRVAEECVIDPVELLALRRDPPDLHLPEIGRDPVPLLRHRVEDGLVSRGLARSREARERLTAEMDIIEKKRLSGYFIAVAGITDMIRGMDVRCAIRGSGAGSLVNYLIGIGEVDPLRHGLLMERFLSEGRVGLPDIDVDVESARRLDCYKAIFDRYGEARVACVSMMETYRARSAIRDVAGAMGLPPHEIDAIAKAFPHIRAAQITASLTDLPELRESRLGEAGLERVFRLAEKLDGLPRHIALHPCGVLIGNSGLRDRTPVERSLLEFPMSQFDKEDVEEAGLLKLDVLGVRMQSAMAYTLGEIERVDDVVVALDQQSGSEPGVEYVSHDDQDTYDMICAGRTLGCFQIESPGQRELVAKLEPRRMHDLIVDISLFRPGPVNSDMVTPYLEARHGWRRPRYPHERLREALKETHGVVVFHEQVLKIISVMTGRDLSFAEMLRRALGTPEGRERVRNAFVPLARANGFDDASVERAWQVLDAFGGFGFCKAHAAAFALPTYQSAWLKRHHAAAFFAGVLTHEPGMYPQRVIIDEARQCGVAILPLDINKSARDWRVERFGPRPAARIRVTPAALGEDDPPRRIADFDAGQLGRGYALRVPFSAIKGVSEAEVGRMVAGQPYTSLADFWDRARPSRPTIERIVQVGGLDELHGLRPGGPRWRPGRLTRRDLIAQVGTLDRASASGVAATARSSKRYTAARPETTAIGADAVQLPLGFTEHVPPGELPEMTEAEMVEAELEILGIDVSRHVISFHDELLDALGVVRSKDLPAQRNGAEVLVAGVKVATQTPAVRSGRRVIFTTLDDSTGPVDLTFFESVQGRCAATVFGAWLLVARGVVRRTGIRAISMRAVDCWDLADLDALWRSRGIEAVRAVLARTEDDREGVGGRPIEYANGFRLSPYSDLAPAVTTPPRLLWHASQGSSGPTAA
ncbi:DNA polymerase III subunit alpha [Nonomuraea cavernae]|uniref:DNA-directed DNA polymerase n=1 Tax=Nonomuraea cavernae TaxID=2045107 RepID=A0A918DQ85_9ACTN|nr:DNA polymerase III subunit alpha [Nonomuraea cavernae]MCA2185669.1 DNA polymerase III subunit alpha [Nonomuraea cavernae]GGO78221.1 DNA-directed DNA polymerase [Nonomuraea cavernae]